MKELFKQQYEHSTPVSEETMGELLFDTYSSGETIKVGDTILYGFMASFYDDNEKKLTLTLFSLCEREFPYYSEIYWAEKNRIGDHYNIPIFVKKNQREEYDKLININLK